MFVTSTQICMKLDNVDKKSPNVADVPGSLTPTDVSLSARCSVITPTASKGAPLLAARPQLSELFIFIIIIIFTSQTFSQA